MKKKVPEASRCTCVSSPSSLSSPPSLPIPAVNGVLPRPQMMVYIVWAFFHGAAVVNRVTAVEGRRKGVDVPLVNIVNKITKNE